MKPEEFLEIINALPDEDRAAYEKDLMMFGRGYVEMTPDGRFRRLRPEDVWVTAQAVAANPNPS